MSRYAYKGTEVPVDRSIGKIKDMLYAHGAVAIQVGESREKGIVELMFARRVKVGGQEMMQPMKLSVEFKGRKPAEAMRMLYHHLKVKFDAVDWGLISFEEEFLPFFVGELPDGRKATVAEMMLPDLKKGRLPDFVPFRNPQLPPG